VAKCIDDSKIRHPTADVNDVTSGTMMPQQARKALGELWAGMPVDRTFGTVYAVGNTDVHAAEVSGSDIYNTAGRRVKTASGNGIYITNGKKSSNRTVYI